MRPNWICNIISLRPHIPSWISGAVWQNDLYASSTLPRASDGIYTRASVYILFMVSRYAQPDDENRAHGGPAPWNSCPVDEGGRGRVKGARRSFRCAQRYTSAMGALLHIRSVGNKTGKKKRKKNLPGDYLPLCGSPRTQRYRYFHARVLMPRREIRPNALYNFSLCRPFERN